MGRLSMLSLFDFSLSPCQPFVAMSDSRKICIFSFKYQFVRQKGSGGGLRKPCRTFHFPLSLLIFTVLSHIFIILKQICLTEKERRWNRKTLQNFSLFIFHFHFLLFFYHFTTNLFDRKGAEVDSGPL